MRLTTMLKSAAAAGALGLGVLLVTAGGASAHYTTTRCDRDGDRCWTVRCDDDGDECQRVNSYYDGRGYRGYGRYNYGYRSGYGSAYGNRDGYWRCDRGGDDCHWVRYGYRDHDRGYDRGYDRDYDYNRY